MLRVDELVGLAIRSIIALAEFIVIVEPGSRMPAARRLLNRELHLIGPEASLLAREQLGIPRTAEVGAASPTSPEGQLVRVHLYFSDDSQSLDLEYRLSSDPSYRIYLTQTALAYHQD